MKKIIALLLIIGMLAGCSFICANKTTITNILQGIIIAAEVLKAEVPATSPVVAMAELAISAAQTGLAKSCPTAADAQAALDAYNSAIKTAQAMGLRLSQ